MQFQGSLRMVGLLGAVALLTGSPQTLREAAKGSGILIGTAVRPSRFSEAAYSETLAREFNMVEPEDAMKWWVLRGSGEDFDFQKGDEIVRYAQAQE